MAVNHRKWFVAFATPYLGDHPIEVSAGLGDYAAEWLQHTEKMALTEADSGRIVALKERFADHPGVSVRELLLPSDVNADHSAAISYNVLEHIDDDIGGLRTMKSLVRPGGYIINVVPAFPFAMGPADIATGHVRRYTKKTMRAAMNEAGLEIVKLHYANSLGLIGYYVSTCLLKQMPGPGPIVKFYDSTVAPMTRLMEKAFNPPFGQSVIAIGRRPLNG
ncbi:methyltransferase domain-containing protein [Dactylosporangium sp. NPDC051541]|uniref:methyltransferase domain-containing protein n=1 Tax=Dactylosporangium sp. NPDC051541 TaxID=3363977 RepID=UPI0037AD9693